MTTIPPFIQIHTLHGYGATLLNRDDAGQPKRVSYGQVMRGRISSQCLKHHWRMAEVAQPISSMEGVEGSMRTRDLVKDAKERHEGQAPEALLDALGDVFQKVIYSPKGGKTQLQLFSRAEMTAIHRLFSEAVAAADAGTMSRLFEAARKAEATAKKSGKKKAADAEVETETEAESVEATESGGKKSALTPEVAYAQGQEARLSALLSDIRGLERKMGKDERIQLPEDVGLVPGGGLIAALFGRFVPADTRASIDAAIHVAHAFTTHAQESEPDYFSAFDDLTQSAGHIDSSELTTGLYYGYVVVDVAQLVTNIEGGERGEWLQDGRREIAAEIVSRLLRIIAEVSPGAKRGATAPYTYASSMFVEMGDSQPRTLAEAFREPVDATLGASEIAMANWLGVLDANYGQREVRRFMSLRNETTLPGATRDTVDGLAIWVKGAIREGAC